MSSSAALFLLKCELSGETVSNRAELVVTPTGHVCRRSLLLAKLAENGGTDPFGGATRRPLSESELVSLAPLDSSGMSRLAIVPPPASSAKTSVSVPALLRQMQEQYDAVFQELFDTRKALEETRQELSRAMHQNDAAVRVVVRLAAERDEATELLQKWNAPQGRPVHEAFAQEEPSTEEPAPKKQKLENSLVTKERNKIPEEDLHAMLQTRQDLREQHEKSVKKKPTMDEIKDYILQLPKGLVATESTFKAIAGSGALLAVVTVKEGETYNLTLYQVKSPVMMLKKLASTTVKCTTSPKKHASAAEPAVLVDMQGRNVAVEANGTVTLWKLAQGDSMLSIEGEVAVGAACCAVSLHPDGQHMVVTSRDGYWLLCRITDETGVETVAKFEAPDSKSIQYSAGALHPDGLIYCTGDKTGAVQVWDIKNQSLACTLKPPSDSMAAGASKKSAEVHSLTISNNGYHVAAAYKHEVIVWDLRKQEVAAVLPVADFAPGKIALSFDESGKLLAGASTSNLDIWTVKGGLVKHEKWTAADCDRYAGCVWAGGNQGIVFAGHSDAKHDLFFYGKKGMNELLRELRATLTKGT